MTKSASMALVVVCLSNTAFAPASLAAKPTGAEQQAGVLQVQDAAPVIRPAIETLRGVVDSIDQSSDTINIRLSPGPIEQLRVQDGLIFNAVRYGDQVEVIVQTIAGARTIVGLVKE
jgi:hypothetical protein